MLPSYPDEAQLAIDESSLSSASPEIMVILANEGEKASQYHNLVATVIPPNNTIYTPIPQLYNFPCS